MTMTDDSVQAICADCGDTLWQDREDYAILCEACDQPDCTICDTVRGCVCDAIYDAWRDDHLDN